MIYVAASIVSDCLLLKLHSRIFDVVPVAALDGLLFGKSHLITYVNATPVDIFLLDMSHAMKANYIIAMLVSIFLLESNITQLLIVPLLLPWSTLFSTSQYKFTANPVGDFLFRNSFVRTANDVTSTLGCKVTCWCFYEDVLSSTWDFSWQSRERMTTGLTSWLSESSGKNYKTNYNFKNDKWHFQQHLVTATLLWYWPCETSPKQLPVSCYRIQQYDNMLVMSTGESKVYFFFLFNSVGGCCLSCLFACQMMPFAV